MHPTRHQEPADVSDDAASPVHSSLLNAPTNARSLRPGVTPASSNSAYTSVFSGGQTSPRKVTQSNVTGKGQIALLPEANGKPEAKPKAEKPKAAKSKPKRKAKAAK